MISYILSLSLSLSLSLLQRIGYRHCKTVLSGWTKNHIMSALLSSTPERRDLKTTRNLLQPSEVNSFSCISSYFSFLSQTSLRGRASSIHDLAALAAEIPKFKPKEEVDNNENNEDITGT